MFYRRFERLLDGLTGAVFAGWRRANTVDRRPVFAEVIYKREEPEKVCTPTDADK